MSTDMAMTDTDPTDQNGPVLFAYDGSELAGFAIHQARGQLAPGREAVILCVWQPADVGFVPISARPFDADVAPEVRRAAEETAAHGGALAERAGFRAQSLAVEAAPTWRGIVDAAFDSAATLIVVGSHRRGGLIGHLHGSLAGAVIAHATCAVMVVGPAK